MDMPKIETPRAAATGSSLRHDFLASIVVFLVALPLCMGIAIASGAPPEKAAAVGIITGIVGGIVVGVLGGSPLQVSGPAAGLSVIVLKLAHDHGWAVVGVIVLLAGAVQLAAGLLRLGQWFRAVSPAVIHAMLAGIGVLIVASQFHVMVDDAPRRNGLQNIIYLPEAIWKGIVPSEGDLSHDWAARIGLLTILLIALWKPLVPRALKVVPAPLVAVVVATAATAFLELPIKTVQLPDNITDAIAWPSLNLLESLPDWQTLAIAALSLAFIASAETLLCATAVDQLHQGPRTRYDRELAAQGVGNMICGLLGALPMTGVIVRSAANVEAGGRSRLSAIMHGVWLLIFVCLLPWVLRWIPTSALAAILVYTGYKLVSIKAIRTLWSYGISEVLIYAATVVTIVATDLLTGVLVGIGLAILKLLATFSHLSTRLETDADRKRTILYLDGAATFIRLPRLAAALEAVPPSHELHVHFENLSYIDHACLDLLINWEKQHESTGGSLQVDWESLTARFRHAGVNRANGLSGARTSMNGLTGSERNGHGGDAQGSGQRDVPAAEPTEQL